jgi:hypothetical protein
LLQGNFGDGTQGEWKLNFHEKCGLTWGGKALFDFDHVWEVTGLNIDACLAAVLY